MSPGSLALSCTPRNLARAWRGRRAWPAGSLLVPAAARPHPLRPPATRPEVGEAAFEALPLLPPRRFQGAQKPVCCARVVCTWLTGRCPGWDRVQPERSGQGCCQAWGPHCPLQGGLSAAGWRLGFSFRMSFSKCGMMPLPL